MYKRQDKCLACQKRNAQHKSAELTSFSLSVVLVDKVYNHFQHGVLFLSTAFRYHQGERHQGIVCDALGAVFIVKDAIAIEKPQEQQMCIRDRYLPASIFSIG